MFKRNTLSTETYTYESSVWLRAYLLRSKLKVGVALLFSVAGVIMSLLKPLPMKVFADSVFGYNKPPFYMSMFHTRHGLLFGVATMSIILFLISEFFALTGGIVMQKIKTRVDTEVLREVLASVLVVPYGADGKMTNGEYLQRLTSLYGSVSSYIFATIVSIIRTFLQMIAMVTVLLFISPTLALVSLVVIPFLFFSTKIFGGKMEGQMHDMQNQETEIYNIATETVEQVRIIQAFNKEYVQVTRFLDNIKNRNKLNLKFVRSMSFFSGINSGVTTFASSAMLVIGGTLVLDKKITFGLLLVFMNYMANLYSPLQELSAALSGYKQQRVQIEKLYAVIKAGIGHRKDSGSVDIDSLKGQITLEKFNFNFGNKVVLKDVSLNIDSGQKIAVIGPSGVGKSTLINLLLRFIEPTSGNILIDNVHLKDYNLGKLRQNIALVDQSPSLVTGTIAENICYATLGDAQVNTKIMQEVASTANADEFIKELPNTYNTEIGVRSGIELSGGQKQRISIARALYKQASILLLDEPTSALDEGSKSSVIDAIKNAMKGHTVILVTHDYELLSAVDVVYVLEDYTFTDVNKLGGIDKYKEMLKAEAAKNSTIDEVVKKEEKDQESLQALFQILVKG
jgi:ABC-type bacteriocin/lantibiotic exporter with double-glycine peptidase domain